MQTSPIDIVAVIFVLFQVFLCLRRGLSTELGRLIGAVAALWLGIRHHDLIAGWVADHTRLSGDSARILALIGTVVVVMVAAALLGGVVAHGIKRLWPESTDRLLGALAGVVKGSVYVVVAVMVLILWPDPELNEHVAGESLIGRTVARWAPTVRSKIESMGLWERLEAEWLRGRGADAPAADAPARRKAD